MKRICCFFLMSIGLICGLSAEESVSSSSAKMRLSLSEAKQLALTQNPTIAQARANIEAAAAAVRQAESAYWPTLGISAGGTNFSDQPKKHPNTYYDSHSKWSITGTLSYTVFDGFQRKMSLMAAQLNNDSAIDSHDDTKRLLLQSVSYAYYTALLAQDSMTISLRDAEFNRELLDDAEKRHNGGLVKPSEVLNFNLKVGEAEVDYYQAESQWKVACVALGKLLGIVEDQIWDTIELELPDKSIMEGEYDLQKLLLAAEQNRPDLKQIQTTIDAYKVGIEAAKGTWYPKVSLFASYGLEQTHSFNFNDDYDRALSYGISADWTLFNGGLTKAQVEEAEARLRMAEFERENLLLTIRSEVRQNLLSLESAINIWKKQVELVEIAEKIRKLVYEEYLGSRATITRVNEVQTDLTIASLACSQSYVQVLNLIENLAASVGTNLE